MSATADFWSRRRAQVAAEDKQEQLREIEEQQDAQERSDAELSDAELVAKYELPDLDSVTSSEDIREFLSDGIPRRLKNMALRKLWRMNPVLANVDGLVDYGEDFANPEVIGDAVKTAYQVGKGMLKHVEALEEEARLEQERALAEPHEEIETSTPSEVEIDVVQADTSAIAEEDAQAYRTSDANLTYDDEDAPEIETRPRRRRMAFVAPNATAQKESL